MVREAPEGTRLRPEDGEVRGPVRRPLPAEFLKKLHDLEDAYLEETDQIRQSGFSGGAERWRSERSPLLEAVTEDGDLLDICCANGHLLECLVPWAAERGVRLTPFGLDQGARLIELARGRFPGLCDHFYVANSWDWEPPRRFDHVYTIDDCVPDDYLEEYVRRLLDLVVAPGGRLIVGSYGGRTPPSRPRDLVATLAGWGLQPAGHTMGGDPPLTAFAWITA